MRTAYTVTIALGRVGRSGSEAPTHRSHARLQAIRIRESGKALGRASGKALGRIYGPWQGIRMYVVQNMSPHMYMAGEPVGPAARDAALGPGIDGGHSPRCREDGWPHFASTGGSKFCHDCRRLHLRLRIIHILTCTQPRCREEVHVYVRTHMYMCR